MERRHSGVEKSDFCQKEGEGDEVDLAYEF